MAENVNLLEIKGKEMGNCFEKDNVVLDVIPTPQLFYRRQQRNNDVKKKTCPSDCIVCYEPLGDEPVTALECAHVFHTSCIKSWLRKPQANNCCPVCKHVTEFFETPCEREKLDGCIERTDGYPFFQSKGNPPVRSGFLAPYILISKKRVWKKN